LWASKTEWHRRGYAVPQPDETPSIPRKLGRWDGVIEYEAYHAYHARLRPEAWSEIVGRLPSDWHHRRGHEPDPAAVVVVHDLLMEHGQDDAAACLRWAKSGTQERFEADLAAYQARVQRAQARVESRKRMEPTLRRRKARRLAREAARRTAGGIQDDYCPIPSDLDWRDRPTLLAYLREQGREGMAEVVAEVNPDELRVRPTHRKSRVILSRVQHTYRGLTAEEWHRVASSKRPVPDLIVDLLLSA
jgi:hypothetical protein